MADARKKASYGLVIFFVCFLIFGFSTLWSIITLGGKEAVGIHMQQVLIASDKQGLKLLKQGSQEANMAPKLSALADQFESYALREAGGAFSGMTGEGDVVSTLRNTAETFRSLADSVLKTEQDRAKLYENLKQDIASARDILSTEDKDMTMRSINLQFSKKLAGINENLTRMGKTTSVEFVTTVSRNLDSLTLVTKESTVAAQREAIERLHGITKGAQEIVSQLTGKEEFAETDVQTFTMISMGNAIIRYASNIFYAWAYAIALDFAPLLFIILLSVAAKDEEKEITLDEARQVRLDAEAAAKTILDNAREKISAIINELKPEIISAAKTAKDGLEESIPDIIKQIRDQVQKVKDEMDSQMRIWREEFQKSKYKI